MLWVVLPLLALNIYACWRLNMLALNWCVSLFRSWSDGLTQLALIIIVNTAVLLILAARR